MQQKMSYYAKFFTVWLKFRAGDSSCEILIMYELNSEEQNNFILFQVELLYFFYQKVNLSIRIHIQRILGSYLHFLHSSLSLSFL